MDPHHGGHQRAACRRATLDGSEGPKGGRSRCCGGDAGGAPVGKMEVLGLGFLLGVGRGEKTMTI